GAQSLFVVVAIAIGSVIGVDALSSLNFSSDAVVKGLAVSVPMLALNFGLKFVFGSAEWLLKIESSTQTSAMILFGVQNNYVKVFVGSLLLSIAAGVGEEVLFRGLLQNGVGIKLGQSIGLAVASIIFGLLHNVTPVYALIATIYGFYFGFIYLATGNLAIPMIGHAFYDLVALIH
ncbi:unnamed protein product, partial [Heterosigma akashiwo]